MWESNEHIADIKQPRNAACLSKQRPVSHVPLVETGRAYAVSYSTLKVTIVLGKGSKYEMISLF